MKPRPVSKHLYDPIALHRRNNAMLTARDVLVPAYPGSGHAFLGNIMLELRLNYSDPYTELFDASGGSIAAPGFEDYRKRLAATAAVGDIPIPRASSRYVKTHLYPRDFMMRPRGIVLLVRDPRDAIHSYYRWRLGFSEEGERGTFEEFLDRPGVNGVAPVVDWIQFAESWLAMSKDIEQFTVIRFEDLKSDGVEALQKTLRNFAPEVDPANVKRAIEASSFNVMLAHETRNSGENDLRRIMRRGKVEEWREWFSGSLARRFDNPSLRRMAAEFGYTDWRQEF